MNRTIALVFKAALGAGLARLHSRTAR